MWGVTMRIVCVCVRGDSIVESASSNHFNDDTNIDTESKVKQFNVST